MSGDTGQQLKRVEVTQADRQTFIDLFQIHEVYRAAVLSGRHDHLPQLTCLARHRLTAEVGRAGAGDAERLALRLDMVGELDPDEADLLAETSAFLRALAAAPTPPPQESHTVTNFSVSVLPVSPLLETYRAALERIASFGLGITHGWVNEVRAIAARALADGGTE